MVISKRESVENVEGVQLLWKVFGSCGHPVKGQTHCLFGAKMARRDEEDSFDHQGPQPICHHMQTNRQAQAYTT